jgi:hypothetical protein
MKRLKHKEKNKKPPRSVCGACGCDTSRIMLIWRNADHKDPSQMHMLNTLESAIDEGVCLNCDAKINKGVKP